MALFSRGKRDRDKPADTDVERSEEHSEEPAQAEPAEAAGAEASPAATQAVTDAAAAASVGISVSAFQGVGAVPPQAAAPQAASPQPTPRAPARSVAPPATETMPGLRDNVLLEQALAALDDSPTQQQILDVARQLLQGQLFLRVQGDARSLLSEGKPLPLAIVTLNDVNFVVAYSGGKGLGASLRNDGDLQTSVMAQASIAVIRHVLSGPYAGLVLDPASMPARAVLRRDMLERMVEGIDPKLELKGLLSGERTEATAAAVVQALTRAPVWVAVSRAGEEGKFGVAEARTTDGERYLEIFSHPLEVVALGRGDRPAPMTAGQLGKALRADTGLTGVVLDPGGPWIRLSRAELGFIISG